MKKHKKKSRPILKLIVLFLIIYGVFNIFNKFSFYYTTVAQSHNSNYSGTGQETVKNKDGYFTTFTTENTHKKTYIEYKQNWTSSWANNEYWGGTMEENGCGITSLSIILSGYDKDYTPENLRTKYFPVLDYENLPKELSNTFNIENSGFLYANVYFSKEKLEEHLLTNRPVLVCLWSENGNNRWTSKSHYMVLLATDGNGKVYVSNPNGLENSINSSGWYDFDYVTPYIAKALYIEKY